MAVKSGIVRRLDIGTLVTLSALVSACASRQAPVLPPPVVATLMPPASVVGIASWYGPGFDGHRTSGGGIYDEEDLTAASTIFPLGTRLLVTNLDNRRSVEVTVNDHGPYLKGRKIDLSRGAARILGVIGPGTARVRMDTISTPPGGPPLGERYFVQVGSFSDAGNARRMRERLAADYPDVRIEEARAGASRYYRVRMGAFMSRHDAHDRAVRVAGGGYPVVIITQ